MKLTYVVALAAGALSAPAIATVSINGSVDAGVRSTLGSAVVTDSQSTPVPAPTTGSAGAAAATATATDGQASVVSFAEIGGTWASTDQGTISLRWGWDIDTLGFTGTVNAETNQVASNWSYTFTASANGFFQGSYNVVGTGNTFGLQPVYTSGDWTSGTLGGNTSDPTGAGTFSVALVAGQTYTMSLFNFGNILTGATDNSATATARIDWAIVAVPEPASWAMMIAGFGLAGAALRRRPEAVPARA